MNTTVGENLLSLLVELDQENAQLKRDQEKLAEAVRYMWPVVTAAMGYTEHWVGGAHATLLAECEKIRNGNNPEIVDLIINVVIAEKK